MKTRVLALTALTLLSVTAVASADIYEWKDAKKERVFSDRPAPDAERVNIPSRPTNPEAVAKQAEANRQQQQANQKLEQKQQGDAAAAKTVEQDVTKIAAERCEKAKKDYQTATESQRLYRVGKDGQREYLTDAELTQARINALKARDESCKRQ